MEPFSIYLPKEKEEVIIGIYELFKNDQIEKERVMKGDTDPDKTLTLLIVDALLIDMLDFVIRKSVITHNDIQDLKDLLKDLGLAEVTGPSFDFAIGKALSSLKTILSSSQEELSVRIKKKSRKSQ
ncbi:MAG: hypothetical protein ABI425_04985 [Patescibacteria group bacterium]